MWPEKVKIVNFKLFNDYFMCSCFSESSQKQYELVLVLKMP